MLASAIAVTSVASCGYRGCPSLFPQIAQTTYSVSATAVTPKGIHVDTSGMPINLAMVDRLVDETEACLTSAYPDGWINTLAGQAQYADGAACGRSHHFILPISRACLTVKVAADWHMSSETFAGSKQQLLHDVASETGDCGKSETGPGACYWRAGAQNDVVIVTTPSFYVFKDPLVRIVTGCAFPWSSPTLSRCMTPTTGALDNGTQP